jgi:hypothetical protein
VACGVHAIELGRKSESCEAAVQAVLNHPSHALAMKIEAVSTPGVTDQVMDGTKPIKRATEPTVEKRM